MDLMREFLQKSRAAVHDYRNAAIPAMVGTSRLLAALNLPIESRAKQIAAGLMGVSGAFISSNMTSRNYGIIHAVRTQNPDGKKGQ